MLKRAYNLRDTEFLTFSSIQLTFVVVNPGGERHAGCWLLTFQGSFGPEMPANPRDGMGNQLLGFMRFVQGG